MIAVPFTVRRPSGDGRAIFAITSKGDCARDVVVSPAAAAAGDRAYVRVRLNGALIDTSALPARAGVIRDTVSLPGELLDVANTLEFDFSDACGRRIRCDTPATAPRLAETSGFAWWGVGAWRGTIGELVALDGPVAIELIDTTPELARTAARMLAAVARHTRTPPESTPPMNARPRRLPRYA